MACWACSDRWPLRVLRMTAALASCCCSVNSDSCGMTRCTRTASTSLKRGQRPFQFAFEGALVVHFFGEVGAGPVGGVEQLKTEARAAGQAGGRGLETAGIELVVGNQKAAAVRGDLMRNVFRGQPTGQSLGLFGAQTGIQRHVLRLSEQRHEHPDRRPHQHRARGQQKPLVQSQPFEELLQAVQYVVRRWSAVGHGAVCASMAKALRIACAKSPRRRTRSCSAPASSAES